MSTQFSNAPIATTTDLGFLKPDGTTTLVGVDGTLSITIPSGTIVRSGTVTVGDVGAGSTGSIPCDGDFASATKSNPDTDTSSIPIVFTTPLPSVNYFCILSAIGTNVSTTILAVGSSGKTVNGFTLAARQFAAVAQTLTVNITVIAYNP